MLLGRVCRELPEGLSTFPAITGEALSVWSRNHGLGEHWQRIARKVGSIIVAVMQHSCYYLAGTIELIYFEQCCGQLFDVSPLCQWQWLLIVGILCVSLMQVPSFHATRWVAVCLGVIPLVLNLAVFYYEIALVRPWSCIPGPTFSPPTAASAAVGLSAMAYGFGGHRLYPELIREMAAPSKWPSVMRATYAVAIPTYWITGEVGYAAYGDFANTNINLNAPDNLANRLSLAVQMAQELFFVLESNLVVVLAAELALNISPAECCSR
jgi:hypothetical protein